MIITIEYRARLSFSEETGYDSGLTHFRELHTITHQIETDTMQTVAFEFKPVGE